MSADRLREAARVLREDATAATRGAPGPWRTWITSDRKWTIVDSNSHGNIAPARCVDDDVAAYIATMHPGVGLALADWLDNLVGQHGAVEGTTLRDDHPALALADLILRYQPEESRP